VYYYNLDTRESTGDGPGNALLHPGWKRASSSDSVEGFYDTNDNVMRPYCVDISALGETIMRRYTRNNFKEKVDILK
ncbi:unnamed protein product, partial [Prorocentrum cordatum]